MDIKKLKKKGKLIGGVLYLPQGVKTGNLDKPSDETMSLIKKTIKTRDAVGLKDVPMTIEGGLKPHKVVEYNNQQGEQVNTFDTNYSKVSNKTGGQRKTKSKHNVD